MEPLLLAGDLLSVWIALLDLSATLVPAAASLTSLVETAPAATVMTQTRTATTTEVTRSAQAHPPAADALTHGHSIHGHSDPWTQC
jgi:hypothetical protein